jgi:CrcB protein
MERRGWDRAREAASAPPGPTGYPRRSEVGLRLLLIGLGGFAGSILRYWLSGLAQNAVPGSTFPLGTLCVNTLGCLAICALSELVEARGVLTPEVRALLIVGLLGGFTTFSAFANETVNALRDGLPALAATNVLLSVASCLIAVWAGRAAVALLWR